jgi:hypothetical protein
MEKMVLFWNLSLWLGVLLPVTGQTAVAGNNDIRTPVYGPLREGKSLPQCEESPDDATVLRAMPRLPEGLPGFFTVSRDDIQIVTEQLVNKVDPPRFYPLVGVAQLHHCHWKCSVYYNEVLGSNFPFPFQSKRPRVQVVYIDRDHLHTCTYPWPQEQRKADRSKSGEMWAGPDPEDPDY